MASTKVRWAVIQLMVFAVHDFNPSLMVEVWVS